MDTQKIKSYLKNGNIKEALDLLPDTDIATSLKNDFSRLEHDERIGIITKSDANTERNRIKDAIAEILFSNQEPDRIIYVFKPR